MRRSSLALWLSLVGGLLGVQCLDPLSDDCTKTLTCSDQARVTLSPDCKWRFPDGGIWTGGPYRNDQNRWVWPDGTETETQDYDCDADAGGGAGDGGLGGFDCTEDGCDSTLQCNTASKRCVECLSNSHCSPDGVCDLARLRCVPCLGRSDCPEGPCRRDPEDSRNNKCVQCEAATGATDCAAGEVCDDAAGECTRQCSDDNGCTDDVPVCDTPRGVCVECNNHPDCTGRPGGPQCDPDTKRCVECVDNTVCTAPDGVCDTAANECVACNSNDECVGANDQCNLDDHKCVACLNDGQCTDPAFSRCNLADHTCVPCMGNAQCEPGAPFCVSGTCVQCLGEADCSAVPGANVCDTMSGACVECTLSSQCASIDESRCDTASHTCAPCTADLDCTGNDPLRDQCQVGAGRCVECEANGDCGDDDLPRCNGTSGLCDRCTADADCARFLATPVCTGGNNARCVQCTESPDCTNPALPVCKLQAGNGNAPINSCVECVSNADCTDPAASRCFQNQCEPCTANPDCSAILGPPNNSAFVCDTSGAAGVCVQCTATDSDRCAVDGLPRVCDSRPRRSGQPPVCSSQQPNTASLCEPCVANAACEGNAVCAQQTFGAANTVVDFFCFPPTTGGACPIAGRPFVSAEVNSLVADGGQADVCGLALTTCPAFTDFGAATACIGDADCGVDGLSDGICVTGSCRVSCGGSGLNCVAGECPITQPSVCP